MAQQRITLDTVVSSLWRALEKWTPELKRNQAPFVLRTLVCRLYGVNSNLFDARIQVSQDALAAHIGLSREWTCKLLSRLEEAGWIVSYAPRLPDGHFLPCIFRIGRQIKRLLYALGGVRKRPPRHGVNGPSQFLPTKADKERSLYFIQELQRILAEKMSKRGP